MTHPVVWAILAGVGIGMTIYYFVSGPQEQENRYHRASQPPDDSSQDYSWRPGYSGQRERRPRKEDRRGDSTCSICLNTAENVDVEETRCGHIFHSKCITKWKRMDNRSCPNCRENIM